ncbi:MAG: hypothetical protein LBR52_00100 [Prevotellaceae bacterium]|jgi:hypothetical protein|nr:hypothetical protein [Prevotellaceae bacterium]
MPNGEMKLSEIEDAFTDINGDGFSDIVRIGKNTKPAPSKTVKNGHLKTKQIDLFVLG